MVNDVEFVEIKRADRLRSLLRARWSFEGFRRLSQLVSIVIVLMPTLSVAADMILIESVLRSGDVIVVRRGDSRNGGCQLSNIGILRETGGGINVLGAFPEHGVEEEQLVDYLAAVAREGNGVSVFRYSRLSWDQAMTIPVLASRFYHRPYENKEKVGDDAFTPVEFVRRAFQNAGHQLRSRKSREHHGHRIAEAAIENECQILADPRFYSVYSADKATLASS